MEAETMSLPPMKEYRRRLGVPGLALERSRVPFVAAAIKVLFTCKARTDWGRLHTRCLSGAPHPSPIRFFHASVEQVAQALLLLDSGDVRQGDGADSNLGRQGLGLLL